jgi:hypothetical protein
MREPSPLMPQSVHHLSEHVFTISPVYTQGREEKRLLSLGVISLRHREGDLEVNCRGAKRQDHDPPSL